MQATFTKTEPPPWLLDMWKEIDDKTFGKGFDCFTEELCATSAWRTGRAVKPFARTCRPSSIRASPPSIMSPNIGMPVS